MFIAYEGKPDPVVTLGRKYARVLMYASLALSLLIGMSQSEEALRNTVLFKGIVLAVGSIVPAIGQAASGSHYPMLTLTLFAINWVFVPGYFVFTLLSLGTWNGNEDVTRGIAERWRKVAKPFTGIGIALTGLLFFLMDIDVIHGIGAFSMGGFHWIFQTPVLHLLDSHPVGIALLYWALCMWEGFFYGATVFFITWRIRNLRKRWRLST